MTLPKPIVLSYNKGRVSDPPLQIGIVNTVGGRFVNRPYGCGGGWRNGTQAVPYGGAKKEKEQDGCPAPLAH